jgi:DNA-binding winged helix-turn-helix (wHTH) protein
MPNSSQQPLYEFEGYRLDPLRRLLFADDGRRVPLKPKVFNTLLHLVRHNGELLEKRTLMQAVWGDVVVDENGLNQHISTLRRVLGERPGDNRFIVTVPGEGYLFVPDVAQIGRRTSTRQ